MVKTMTMTKGALSSSFGAWLFLGVAMSFLLLPTAFGYSCHFGTTTSSCEYGNEEYCVKLWYSDGEVKTRGCSSSYDFSITHGFAGSKGCEAPSKGGAAFACACRFRDRDLCNDETFGVDKYNKWKAQKEKEDANKGPSGGGGGGGSASAGLVPSKNLLQGTLTLLTLGTILGR